MDTVVSLSVRGLVEFVLRGGSIDSRYAGADRMAEGSRIHRRLQKAAGEQYKAEVSMKAVRIVDGVEYRLDGRADGVITESDGIVIDEIKSTAVPAEYLTEDFNRLHWAQAQCYAAFYCADYGLEQITVQLTYFQIDTGDIIRHRKAFSAYELETFLTDTLRLYTRWAELLTQWRTVRNSSIAPLAFPFPTYRAGQRTLAATVYRCIRDRERLFVCAPTGIGKTISTLFPAVKALGESCGERIFYLTAKTITRQAAEDAVARLRTASGGSLRLKTLTLTAKDKVCFLDERNCTPEACPYANGYYDRINDALYDFLQTSDDFTRETIAAFAKEKTLCPFELGLDLSNFCDCIIGDYNYLFDPVVSLKRFFEEGGDFIFLIDEAHNLVHRAREMYSARLLKSNVYDVKKQLGKEHRKLAATLNKLNSAFIELRRRALEAPEQRFLLPEGDKDLAKLVQQFTTAAEGWLEDHREGAQHAAVLQLYFDARFFLRIWELYDVHFTTLVSAFSSEVAVELLCLDASTFLDASMGLGRSSVLFSATLLPASYFITTLGGGEAAKHLPLTSPFAADHLCLLSADTVSTKYADRARTLDDVCALISAVVEARQGNYIVFCPSYRYMRDIADRFRELWPSLALAVQESGMDEAARETYLAQFNADNSETLVGFCVLGGIFAEGIDLTGERLIGTIIVGVGLPQIGAQQNALRDYYQETLGSGFEYAYQFPGMNKVLQAAGRVIRTEDDRGVVLLIDSRYALPAYHGLFPPHWAHCRRVRDAQGVSEALKAFWNQDAESSSCH